MLETAGLRDGDYGVVRVGGMAQRFADLCHGNNDATLLSAPYDLLAQQSGLRVLRRLESPYQGNVGAARRQWAMSNPDLVVGYIRGYLAAVHWLYDLTNKAKACVILERHVPSMTAELAAASYTTMLDPERGFLRDGRVQEAGVKRVLSLRSRYAAERRILNDPGKYVDFQYWEQARGSGDHRGRSGNYADISEGWRRC
jgi:ABC-type nitrate/sulfonate/bicarbonate transport system substrate-binding protein